MTYVYISVTLPRSLSLLYEDSREVTWRLVLMQALFFILSSKDVKENANRRRVRIRNLSKQGLTLFVNSALSCAQDIQTLLIGQLIIKFNRWQSLQLHSSLQC